MAQIFISYRRNDEPAAAGRIYDALLSLYGGDTVFKDVDRIRPGQNFEEIIRASFEDTILVIAVVGNRWEGKRGFFQKPRLFDPHDWVRTELAIAAERGIPVIPTLIDRKEFPSKNTLPESLLYLSKIHAPNLRHDWWNDDLSVILETIHSSFGDLLPAHDLHQPNATSFDSGKILGDQERRLGESSASYYPDEIVDSVSDQLGANDLYGVDLAGAVYRLFNRSSFETPFQECPSGDWGWRLHIALLTARLFVEFDERAFQLLGRDHYSSYKAILGKIRYYQELIAMHLFRPSVDLGVLKDLIETPEYKLSLTDRLSTDEINCELNEKLEDCRQSLLDSVAEFREIVGKSVETPS